MSSWNISSQLSRAGVAWRHIALALIIVISTIVIAIDSQEGRRAQAEPCLYVPESALTFGEAVETHSHVLTLPLTNNGKKAVSIHGFSSSCTCLSIDPPTLTLGPTERKQLTVTLDLTKVSGSMSPMHKRPFQATVRAHVADSSVPPIEWHIQGTVTPVLDLGPGNIHFGAQLIHDHPCHSRTLAVTSAVPLHSIRAICEPGFGTAKVIPLSPRSMLTFALEVTPNTAQAPGAFRYDIILEPVTMDGATLPSRRCFVWGVINGEARALPSAILFGACRQGEAVTQEIQVYSAKGNPLSQVSIAYRPPNIRVEPLVESSTQCTYRISCIPSQAGLHEGTVRFMVQLPGDKVETLAIPVSSFGLAVP